MLFYYDYGNSCYFYHHCINSLVGKSIKMQCKEVVEHMRLKRIRSAPYLQCKLKISYVEAKKICDELIFDAKENIWLTRMNNYLEKLE